MLLTLQSPAFDLEVCVIASALHLELLSWKEHPNFSVSGHSSKRKMSNVIHPFVVNCLLFCSDKTERKGYSTKLVNIVQY